MFRRPIFTRRAARAERLAARAAFVAAAAQVAGRHGVPLARVVAPPSPADQAAVALASRGLADPTAARVAAARREALYLAVTVCGRPGRSVARAAGLHHRAVQKALAAVEDKRDDPQVDRALGETEVALMGA
jgi:hypothetical protein